MKNQLLFIPLLLLNALAFSQSNTFPMTGNVGIGTTSPQRGLHLYGTSGIEDIRQTKTGTNGDWTHQIFSDGSFKIYDEFSAKTPLTIYTGTNDNSLVLSGNYVGIGTSSPNSLLELKQRSEASTLGSQGLSIIRAGGSSTHMRMGFLNTGKALLATDASDFEISSGPKITLSASRYINFVSSGSASQGAFTFKGLGGDEFVKFHAITKNVIIGGAGSDPTSSTRLDVRGFGTTTNTAFRIADNANTEVMKVLDNGTTSISGPLTISGGQLTLSSVGSNAAFQQWKPYSNNTESVMSIPSGSTDQGLVIKGFGATINVPVYDAISFGNTAYSQSSGAGGQFRSLHLSPILNLTGTYAGTVIGLDYDPIVTSLTGVTHIAANFAKGQVRLGEINNDDALTQVLVRDSGTGELKYRNATTLMGSSSLWSSSGSNAFFDSGNIGIGTSSPQNKLDVNGTIHTKEVRVDVLGWPDYVFGKDYELQSLDEVKNFIAQNKRLPELPSAQEAEEDGVMLGEMNKLLLKKIEEMTLYVIEQNKVNQEQSIVIQKLEQRLNALEHKN